MYKTNKFKKNNNYVDIIVPNYNKGEFLEKAIHSVLNQTFTQWRLILIDDNSKDGSIKILKKFEKKKKIKIFYLKRNRGPSYCRNFGIKKSKSKFIAFLDSDDYWVKNKLEIQLKYMNKNSYPFTFTDYIPFIQKKKIKWLKRTKIEKILNFSKFIFNSSINTSTMIIKRKYLQGVFFRKINIMEDYIFKCELMKKKKIPFMKVDFVSAYYRIMPKSRSSKKLTNIYYLWKINKKFNNLSLFKNFLSIFLISYNSLKKYGLK